MDTDTEEFQERPLQHREEAEKFYRDLAAQGMKVGETPILPIRFILIGKV